MGNRLSSRGARVWLVASTSAEPLYLDVPGHPRGTLLVGAPRWFVFAGRTNASGILTRSYTLGPLPPVLDAQIFFGQALALIPSLSVLGEGSMLVALDASL